MTEPKPRRRARTKAGHFKADDPTTEVNEAWEPVEAESALPKEKDYKIKAKIEGPSSPTSGKYSKKPKIRPTFGTITTTNY